MSIRCPSISKAEWEVMEADWGAEPATAAQVVERLAGLHEWKHQTIRTMLSRLVNKGALAYTMAGKVYWYRSAFRRDEFVLRESRQFVKTILRDLAGPALVRLVDDARLTKGDIDELKEILNKKKPQ